MTSLTLWWRHMFYASCTCIPIQSHHKFKSILSDNLANISRNKIARAKVLEFIDHPSYIWSDFERLALCIHFPFISSYKYGGRDDLTNGPKWLKWGQKVLGSAKDILYAKEIDTQCLYMIFSMTSQTYDIINVVVTSRFIHPAFYISIQSQHK